MKAVQDSLEEFKQLGCKVVVVTSGSREDGLKWRGRNLDNTLSKMVDSKWVLYRKLNLRRQVYFQTRRVSTHAEKLIAGIPLAVSDYTDDDLCIMGADFIARRDGLLVYALHQQTIDRPSTEELLSVLKENQDRHN